MNYSEEYNLRIKRYSDKKQELAKKYNLFSGLRLATFLGTVFILWYQFSKAEWVSFGVTVGVFIVVFTILALLHQKIAKAQLYADKKLTINKENKMRLNEEWVEFEDTGNEFRDEEHPYINDLDIFGRNSLFQWINVTKTYFGRTSLSKALKFPSKNKDEILSKQKAMKELSSKIDFCQDLQCEGSFSEKLLKEPKELYSYVKSKLAFTNKKLIVIYAYALPIITLIMVALILLLKISYIFLVILVGMQIITNLIFGGRINGVLKTVYTNQKNIAIYSKLFKLIEVETFNNELLKSYQESFLSREITASSAIKKLESISERINARYNPFLFFFLNNFLLWDLHCVIALERWKSKASKHIEHWFEGIGQFEALASIAMLYQLNPDWVLPSFSEEFTKIEAKTLGHPLIFKEKRVVSDFDLNKQIAIVTGSNMSGKSTLLRTVGINLVLAYAGAPVCAKSFSASIMDIFTSMRVVDDINSGVSMFYAELLRIKTIIEKSKKDEPMLFLIDEIFRGTNSKDRIAGSKSVIKNLSKPWIMGLISTHDLELCDTMEDKNDNIKNYYFTEYYENNKICFDYKLRKGISNTTNAIYLMKMVGIELEE